MTFTDVKELLDLPVGERIVVNDDDDNPYVKVSEEWMQLQTTGLQLRLRHFEGAVKAGLVAKYDPEKVRVWSVRQGSEHYSLAIEPDADGNWRCWTFHLGSPGSLYYNDPIMLGERGMGRQVVDPDDVPWALFTRAIATRYAALWAQYQTDANHARGRQEELNSRNREMRETVRRAEALRLALAAFTETSTPGDVF